MKFNTLQQIKDVADVQANVDRLEKMSKRERLERWADVLDRQDGRCLRALVGTEFATPRERNAMRTDDSPLTVAFEDPVLRDEGLKSDKLGDAIDFFKLTNEEAHRLVCYCHYGRTMSPEVVAASVRSVAKNTTKYELRNLQTVFAGVSAVAAAMLVISAL